MCDYGQHFDTTTNQCEDCLSGQKCPIPDQDPISCHCDEDYCEYNAQVLI